MDTAPAPYFCFKCNKYLHRDHVQNYLCRFCNTGFIEEVHPGVNNLTPDDPSRSSSPNTNNDNNAGVSLNQLLGMVIGPNGIAMTGQRHSPQNNTGSASAGGNAPPQRSTGDFIQSTLMPAFLQAMASQTGNNAAGQNNERNNTANQQPRQGAGTDDADVGGGFLQQLLTNLIPANTSVRIQFGNGGMGVNLGDFVSDGNFDEIVTQILNQFDPNASAARISDEDLQHLPRSKVSKQHVDNEAQCTTCMDQFNLNEEVAELGCHHIFHPDCIIPWLRSHNTCPICRQEVNPQNWRVQNPANPLPPENRNGFQDDDLD